LVYGSFNDRTKSELRERMLKLVLNGELKRENEKSYYEGKG